MGQQQILLIVLSVILVGIAVAVGISMFNNQQQQSEIDTLVTQLNNAGTSAYQYYLKPTSLGGAGRDATTTVSDSDDWLPDFEASTYSSGTLSVANDTGTLCDITANTPTSNQEIEMQVNTDGSMTVNMP